MPIKFLSSKSLNKQNNYEYDAKLEGRRRLDKKFPITKICGFKEFENSMMPN